ncbi:DUF4350 domain-containing protein [Rhodoflexus sp.]
MKGNNKYIALVIGSFLLLLAVEYLTPKPIDWRTTYRQEDKIPYGNYILYRQLPTLFNQPVTENTQTFYERLLIRDTALANYILIQEDLRMDSLDTQVMLQLVRNGSDVFIAAQSISSPLSDSLQLAIFANYYLSKQPVLKELTDSVGLFMVNPLLKAPLPYFLKRGSASYHFASAKNAIVLGQNTYRAPVFIRVPYGKGNFWLHSVPQIFTNYYMLYGNHREYIASALSYLPEGRRIIWDEYYKTRIRGSRSPVRFLLSQPPLAWAWRLSLFTLLIFALFGIKRRQKAIPIIRPPENTSLEFVKAVGRLYFINPDHKAMAKRKIRFFMEQLRQQHGITTAGHFPLPPNKATFDPQWLRHVARKTGADEDTVHKLFRHIAWIESTRLPEITANDLMQLSRLMEAFKGVSA